MRVLIGENCGSLRMSTGCCCCESLRCTCHWYCPCPKTALSSILPSLSVGNLWQQMQAIVFQKQQYGFDTDDHQKTWRMNFQLVMERFNFSSKFASKVVACCLISSPALSTHALLPGSATREFESYLRMWNCDHFSTMYITPVPYWGWEDTPRLTTKQIQSNQCFLRFDSITKWRHLWTIVSCEGKLEIHCWIFTSSQMFWVSSMRFSRALCHQTRFTPCCVRKIVDFM